MLAATVCVACWFGWLLVRGKADGMDAQAVRRIERECGFEAACKVRLGDLFQGNWDTFYEFPVGISQAQVNMALGSDEVRVQDSTRTLVLTRQGRVVAHEAEPVDPRRTMNGEILIADAHSSDGIVKLDRDTWLRVLAFPVDAGKKRGTAYQLTTEDR